MQIAPSRRRLSACAGVAFQMEQCRNGFNAIYKVEQQIVAYSLNRLDALPSPAQSRSPRWSLGRHMDGAIT